MNDQPRILVIIPCYNEQGSIGNLLDEIASCGENYETLVVSDGSKDATYEIAIQKSHTIRLLRNLGIGGAVQTGIKYAAYNKYDFCVQIDGDGQHPPDEIKKLWQAYEKSPRSIVIGSRYLQQDTFQSSFARRSGGKAIATLLNKLYKNCNVTDPTSGMRLMDHQAIDLFADWYPFDYPEPISLAWALNHGLSVGECAVNMRPRNKGQSSIIGLKPIGYMIRVLGYIVLTRLKI